MKKHVLNQNVPIDYETYKECRELCKSKGYVIKRFIDDAIREAIREERKWDKK